jgi:hypothetical protein
MIAKIGQRWQRQGLTVEVMGYEASIDYVCVKVLNYWRGYSAGAELKFDGYKFDGIMKNDMCFEYLVGQDKPQG